MPGIPVFLVSEKLVFRQILAEKEGARTSSLRSLAFPSSLPLLRRSRPAVHRTPVSSPSAFSGFDSLLLVLNMKTGPHHKGESLFSYGGEGGSRTLARVIPPKALAKPPLQPLGYFSVAAE